MHAWLSNNSIKAASDRSRSRGPKQRPGGVDRRMAHHRQGRPAGHETALSGMLQSASQSLRRRAIDEHDRLNQLCPPLSQINGNVLLASRRPCFSSRLALFDRPHRLASHPSEGVNLLHHGERLGRVVSMLQGVPVALRSPASGPVHSTDAMGRLAIGTVSRSASIWRRT